MSLKSSGSPGRSYHNRFSSSSNPIAPAPPPESVIATGGTKFTDNGFTYHVFTGISSDFVVTQGGTVEILLVGGGGSGSSSGGGGGAGGVVHDSSLTITDTTYTVEVGEGGDWTGTPSCSGGSSGLPGYATTFKNSGPVHLIALGGGGGAYCPDTPSAPGTPTPAPAGSGGSGGGGGRVNPGVGHGKQPDVNQVGASGNLVNYGNNGASGPVPGGGGGGASAAGSGGPAGDGQPFPNFPAPIFSPVNFPASWTSAVGPTGLFGGGGGGGGYPSATPFDGGTGGGGDSAGYDGSTTGSPGEDHTGGGGGSGSYPGLAGGSGGTGILIIRYSTN